MNSLHHINMLEFNRKHHRRRHPNENRWQQHPITSLLSWWSKTTQTQRVAPSNSQRSCHNKQATISQITFLIATIVYLLCPDKLCPSPISLSFAQQQQNFLLPGHNMENLRIPESQPIDSVVYQLKAADRFNENRKFQYHMTGDTFSVDELSGEVRLSKSLDRERQPFIVVVISVFDAGDSKSDLPVESKRRTIMIDDIDDSWPAFLHHKNSIQSPSGHSPGYQIDLPESTNIGSIAIGEILVTDADEGANAELIFECRIKQSSNQACEVFALESRRLTSGKYSVSIRTRQRLDYERVTSYKLSLVARGKRPSPLKGVPLETETIVTINVLNVQDEGPQFVNAPYSVSMPENLKPGTRLLNLVVQDGDSTPQRDLSMIVVPGPYSDYFQVSKDVEQSNLWYLETNNTIDRESPLINGVGNMFTISLLAAELDESSSPVASEAELLNALRDPIYANGTLKKENVTILVLDSPDSRPIFVQASTGLPLIDNHLTMNISESLITGSSIPNLDLAVLDMDQGMNSRFNLSLVDSDTGPAASQAFGLDSEIIYGRSEIVLHIMNSSLLDYENPEQRVYRFSLVASKNRNPSLVQILEVQFNIVDANDNSPEFERDQFVIDIPEGMSPGSLVAIIKAQDRDSGINGKIDYMLRGPGSSKFKLFSNEGKITVNDCTVAQCLDYEAQPTFSLAYEARDGAGRTKNVSVIINLIDMNDHAPKFTEPVYKRDLISDNLSSKHNYISPQLIVRAIDGDGSPNGKSNITYKISKSNLTSLDVDSVSGLVYLQQPLDLDSILSQQQNLRSNQRGSTSGSHDFDQPSQDRKILFEAEVVAEDNGTPMRSSSAKILIVVKGNPDGAPQFKQDQYYAFVRENQPPNRTFFQVQATDPDDKDSQLRYSVGYDPNDLISISPQTAELSFKTRIDYDDFKGQPYNVTIYATDNSRPNPLRASTIVSIAIQDVNDKPPRFEEMEYKATLFQGKTKVGDHILQVQAKDVDMTSLLNYSILTDMISIRDRNGQEFSLNQLANSTNGYLSHMNRIDRLGIVDDLRKLFSINKTTGSMALRYEPDYSLAASITLVIQVTDLNQETSPQNNELQEDRVNCTIFMQTHVDKSPIFASPWSIERQTYSLAIMEELPLGTTIFSLLAKDPGTNQRIDTFEKLFESDPYDYFRVDRSGLVTINKRIDYEELAGQTNPLNKTLSVSVKAINNEGFYSIANLFIRVLDLNDNAPQFKAPRYTALVSEGATYPQEVLTVSAEDKDSGDFGQVYYSISEGSMEYFNIDPRRGAISIKKGVRLDRDSVPSLFLMVTASDCNSTTAREPPSDAHHSMAGGDSATSFASNCRKSSVPVDVTLEDTNDNDPVFMDVNKKGEFEAMIPETASIGSLVTEVQAIDADEGSNGLISYEIVIQGSSDQELASRLIKIDPLGLITVAGSLSGMGRQSPYRITIRAYDHGKQSRQSYAHLLLTINDVVRNDGVPRFIRPRTDEIVNLSESAGPGTPVYRVQALDPDEETNGRLMYKFAQQTGDMFDIDPFTGLIKTQNRQNFYLDRELVPNYTLIVVAQDLGSPPKQAHQVLTIRITDVNDNEPYFERELDDPPLSLYVDEEQAPDSLIGSIQAIDRDIGSNALIGYEIIDGNHDNLFRLSYNQPVTANTTDTEENPVGNNPCQIYTTARLDRELRDSYLLTIKATSLSKLRSSFIHQLKDPLGGRNPFNKYNASDFSKIQVKINLLDINDNRPQFEKTYTRSVVDSGAEIFSQLVEFKANDADSSSFPILYSILDAVFYSDARYRLSDESGFQFHAPASSGSGSAQPQGVSVRHVFDLDPRSGILRNSIPLRPYIDGYFEVFVKADSGLYNQLASGGENSLEELNQLPGETSNRRQQSVDKCLEQNLDTSSMKNITSITQNPFADQENCSVAVAKATVFVTHQRETFRFVFNKTKLNDRLDEFKMKMQSALEELMFEPLAAQASTQGSGSWTGTGNGHRHLDATSGQTVTPRADKIYLNTFNTDFLEREDGSLDFNMLTSCSQLVKFEDRSSGLTDAQASTSGGQQPEILVPNQVIGFDQALGLLRSLNASQTRQHRTAGGPSPLFHQYGLIGVERCTMDKTVNRMSISERLAIYLALMIALVGSLLAFAASRMRKSYERHLKLLQRSKYQYMNQYATMPPGAPLSPGHHHISLGALQAAAAAAAANNPNFLPTTAYSADYDGPVYDTWQL